MAETLEGARLTEGHRLQQARLADSTASDVASTWPLLDPTDLKGTGGRWANVAEQIVLDGFNQSAALGGAYFSAFTEIEQGYPSPAKRATFVPAPVRKSLEFTGLGFLGGLIASGYSPEFAATAALSLVMRAASRHVLDGGRSTVVDSTAGAPELAGWRRIGRAEACPFCRMLIGRGEVYSARNALFASHDRCKCAAEPAYGGEPISVGQYTPSKRVQTEADKKRLREFLRKQEGLDPLDESVSLRGMEKPVDYDAGRSAADLRIALASLERGQQKFNSPGIQRRVDDLRRKISERS